MNNIKSRNSAAEVEAMLAENGPLAPMAPVQTSKKKKGPKIILTIILIVVIIFVILLVVSKVTSWNVLGLKKNAAVSGEVVKASEWQAVFLSNGQVYFGKLKNVNTNYPTLEDVYYLQVQNVPIQPAQPATEQEGVQPAEQTQQQLILVKFGTEMHQPMDKMYINKDHILMFEDLSQTSAVVEAISGYKNQQAGGAAK